MSIRIAHVLILMAVVAVACQRQDGPGPAVEQEATPAIVPPKAVPSATASAPPTGTPTEEASSTPPPPTATPLPPTPVPPTLTVAPTLASQPVQTISLAPLADGFVRPTYLTHAFDERIFVAEQAGRVLSVRGGEIEPEPFLDIRDRVGSVALEQGLLSIAFHPDYQLNGLLYVNYTDQAGNTVVSRFQVRDDEPGRVDADSELLVLHIPQPFANHNGGQLQFGPDGLLYIGMGDGGSAGDPQTHGQNPSTLLGALLRLDVDSDEPYSIPPSNPFVGDAGRASEVWAYGLRNPWRFTFDRLTGDLYIADVGQRAWEEINVQPAGSPGGQNYGWNVTEGSHCFLQANCEATGLIAPVAEYGHDQGCSITGGYVYRGLRYPELSGNYFFGDWCTGTIWSLVQDGDGNWIMTQVLQSGLSISSFGEDAAGEIYVLDQTSGAVLQVRP